MKRLLPLIVLLFGIAISSAAQQMARVEQIEIDSDNFPFKRPILIFTPDQYDSQTESEFDVIYVFDSQWRSRFDLVHSLLHYGCQIENEAPHPFIVVGVASPDLPKFNYERNRDFYSAPVNIPRPEKMYEGYECAPIFKKFIIDELMPFINANYRTSGHTLAIGHSLSASFILDALATDNMFDDYIAISPNLEWDDGIFGNGLINYDFNNNEPRYIFLSMANECEETGWGSAWRPAWDKVKNHFESNILPDYIKMRIREYPEYSHYRCYQPVIIDALTDYAIYRLAFHHEPKSKDAYPVHLEVSGEHLSGDIYITGNQEALAQWNPKGIKMQQVNDSTYSIDLNLRLPAEFKFTQGSWENQLWIDNAIEGNLRITDPSKAVKHYKTY